MVLESLNQIWINCATGIQDFITSKLNSKSFKTMYFVLRENSGCILIITVCAIVLGILSLTYTKRKRVSPKSSPRESPTRSSSGLLELPASEQNHKSGSYSPKELSKEAQKWVLDIISKVYSPDVSSSLDVWLEALNTKSKSVTAEKEFAVQFETFQYSQPPEVSELLSGSDSTNDAITTCNLQLQDLRFDLRVVALVDASKTSSTYTLNIENLKGKIKIYPSAEKNVSVIKFVDSPVIKSSLQSCDKEALATCALEKEIVDIAHKVLSSAVIRLQFEQCSDLNSSTKNGSNLYTHTDQPDAGTVFARHEQRLLVKVVKAMNLGGAKGCHNPFCVIEMDDPYQRFCTVPAKQTNNCPEWNESFLFNCQNNSAEILLEVYDKLDIPGQKNFLGLTIFNFDEITKCRNQQQTFQLQSRPNEQDDVSGTIIIEFLYMEGSEIAVIETPIKQADMPLEGHQPQVVTTRTFQLKTDEAEAHSEINKTTQNDLLTCTYPVSWTDFKKNSVDPDTPTVVDSGIDDALSMEDSDQNSEPPPLPASPPPPAPESNQVKEELLNAGDPKVTSILITGKYPTNDLESQFTRGHTDKNGVIPNGTAKMNVKEFLLSTKEEDTSIPNGNIKTNEEIAASENRNDAEDDGSEGSDETIPQNEDTQAQKEILPEDSSTVGNGHVNNESNDAKLPPPLNTDIDDYDELTTAILNNGSVTVPYASNSSVSTLTGGADERDKVKYKSATMPATPNPGYKTKGTNGYEEGVTPLKRQSSLPDIAATKSSRNRRSFVRRLRRFFSLPRLPRSGSRKRHKSGKDGESVADAAIRNLESKQRNEAQKSVLTIQSVSKDGDRRSTTSPKRIFSRKDNLSPTKSEAENNGLSRTQDRKTLLQNIRRRLSFKKNRSQSLEQHSDYDGSSPHSSRSASADRYKRSPRFLNAGGLDNGSARSSISEASGISASSRGTFINEKSSLIIEALENGILKHYLVSPSMASRNKWKKKGVKLHIYNDHIFIAKHFKSSSSCGVCKKSLARRLGKQGYECRDCALVCHKHCHIRVETFCPNASVATMEIEYVQDPKMKPKPS